MRTAAAFATAEALCFLLIARLLLWLVPVPALLRFLSRPLAGAAASSEQRDRARERVRLAVFSAWRLGWLRDTCFHRAIAAHLMLRFRGVPTQFHYGAASLPQRGLTGHVWLTHGPTAIVGHDAAAGYRPLMSWGDDSRPAPGVRASGPRG